MLREQPGLTIQLLAPARFKAWSGPSIDVNSPTETDRDSLQRWLAQRLEDFQPDLMMVDVFPRGILGEIPLTPGLKKVLVSRWVPPQYYQNAKVAEALAGYTQVFSSEPLAQRIEVPPIVWTRCEVAPRQARETLGGDARPLVVALGSGPPSAQQKLRARLQERAEEVGYQLRFFSPRLGPTLPQIGHFLHGSDLIVSAAGYQSYHEILQSGVPSILLPQRRRYDNQAARALGHLGVKPRVQSALASGPEELHNLIPQLLKAPKVEPANFNGAQEVARRVLNGEVDSPR